MQQSIPQQETFNTKAFLLECWGKYQSSLIELSNETMRGNIIEIEEPSIQLHDSTIQFINGGEQGQPSIREFTVTGTRDDLPISTTFYVTLNQNVRVVNPTPIMYENLTPYSVLCDPSQSAHTMSGVEEKMFDVQKQNKKYFSPQEEQFINLLCQQLSKKCGGYGSMQKIKELANLMNKDPIQLVKRFSQIYKGNLPQQDQEAKRKHFFYGSCDQFCNICFLYSCSTHYPQTVKLANELYEPEHKDHYIQNQKQSDSPYESRIKPNNEAMRRISQSGEPINYECIDQSKCFKKITSNQVSLKKFQKHWIDMLCGYGIANSCLIAKVLDNKHYLITCSQIKSFLDVNQNLQKTFADRGFVSPLTKKRLQPNVKHALRDDVIAPCFHDSACGTQECTCDRCYKFCCCPPNCQKRVGCSCEDCGQEVDGRFVCPCRTKRIECDPDVCACPADKQQINARIRSQKELCCINTPVTYGVSPRLLLSKSLICDGLGVFAGQNFDKYDFIGEYMGAILDEFQSNIIESLDQVTGHHYLFVLNAEEQVDGKKMGNKTRFVNHALPPVSNCDCQVVVVNGKYKVQMFAKRIVSLGEELFFDYSDEFKTEWKLNFDKMSNQHFKIQKDKK